MQIFSQKVNAIRLQKRCVNRLCVNLKIIAAPIVFQFLFRFRFRFFFRLFFSAVIKPDSRTDRLVIWFRPICAEIICGLIFIKRHHFKTDALPETRCNRNGTPSNIDRFRGLAGQNIHRPVRCIARRCLRFNRDEGASAPVGEYPFVVSRIAALISPEIYLKTSIASKNV